MEWYEKLFNGIKELGESIYKGATDPFIRIGEFTKKNIIDPINNKINETKNEFIENNTNKINDIYQIGQELTQPLLNTTEDIFKEIMPEEIGDKYEEAKEQIIPNNTEKNIEEKINSIDFDEIYNRMEELQKKQWEREDLIRKEIQEREDTAYQRAATDARKAGINLNLTGIQTAQSGSGITSATGQNETELNAKLNEQIELLKTMIEQDFKADENKKERLGDLIGNIIQTAATAIILKNTR